MVAHEKIAFSIIGIGLLAVAASCSGGDEDPGGDIDTGGSAGLGGGGGGGAGGAGGATSNGGSTTAGGAPSNGGFVATGGFSPTTGGITGAGGGPGTGGFTPATGGITGNGGAAPGSGGTPVTGGTSGTGGTPTGPGCLKPGGDFTKKGPYAVTRRTVDLKDSGTLNANAASPTTATIFHPTQLEASCKHPVVSWGNGTTVTGPDVYAFMNENAASWGIIVIAADNSNAASANFLPAGIDFMIKENTTSGSPFYQKLSGRFGTSGHSQGAIAATTATNHPSVSSEVQVQGGGRAKAGVSLLVLTGTADNIVGTAGPEASYNGATGPAMFANYQGADHISTPTLAGYIGGNAGSIQYMRFYTAWFRCFLADDQTACGMFKGGTNCGVCKDPNWAALKTKNM